MLALPSLDYVPGPEELDQAPPSPVYVPYVPEPVYLKFMPMKDDVLPAEEKPLPVAVLPTADSPGYISESDLEEDPEEDDEDSKEDPANYPTDRDDDDDEEEEEESSRDEADDREEDEDEDEEEHPALADSVPPHVHRVARLLSIPTPLPSPLSPLSSSLPHILSPLPQILSPPLPVSPPPLHASPTHPLGYRATIIQLRVESPSTSHLLPPSSAPPSGIPPLLPIPLSTPSPPLLLPSTSRRADAPEVTLPPRNRLCIALGLRFEVGESSSAPTARPIRGLRADYGFVVTLDDEIKRDPERDVGYGITNTWDEMIEGMPGAPATDVAELSQRMLDFVTTVRQDTYEIYGRLDDAHDDRLSREAWRRSMKASDTAHSEVMAFRTIVLAQQAEIRTLRTTDRTRQTQLVEILTLMRILQTQLHHCIIFSCDLNKMAPKRTTRSTPATTTTTPPVTNAQLKALIDQGVDDALAARDADRSRNGDDSHNSGTGSRRTERTAREFENQVKFATCTLHSVALTWWNTHVKTVGHDAAYESDKIEKYVSGLPDMIHESVMASKLKTMQDAIEIATELVDKKISTLVERQAENKRKLDNNNQAQQKPPKKKGVAIAYTVGSGERKESPAATNNQRNLTCYECGNQGHYRSDCSKLKNQNHGNQTGGTGAHGMVHALGGGEINQDLNNMEDDINA
ncbi:putative reverse transcriptase domain-containing protein [Tanacetum coccineum]